MADKPLRIVLSGYYGCGNIGDEAVLSGIIHSLRKASGERELAFTVLSRSPEETRKMHNVPAVNRMRFVSILNAMKDADIFLSGGGSLLQDTTSLQSLFYYLSIAAWAKRMHIPSMFYAQGIGPLRRRISRLAVKIVARQMNLITVRDPDSADMLREIGVNHPDIRVTADPAFALEPCGKDRIHEILLQEGISEDQPYFALALRAWIGVTAKEYASFADRLSEVTGISPLFLAMHTPSDLEFILQVIDHMKRPSWVIRDIQNPTEMLGVVSMARGLIGMRLHALIFGAACQIPLLSISYDPKVRSFMNQIHSGEWVYSLQEFEGAAAAERFAKRLALADDAAYPLENMKDLTFTNAQLALAITGIS
jgi:polysaccharide pyruvyl transferase CsaB